MIAKHWTANLQAVLCFIDQQLWLCHATVIDTGHSDAGAARSSYLIDEHMHDYSMSVGTRTDLS